ncbi:hypothetical protein Ndes2526B_g01966 [Nannochloris sp. 'desiccata']
MEDQEERDARWEKRLRAVHAASQSAKERMQLPTKPWGFWRNDKNNGKYEINVDPAISRMPGRSKPQL